MPDDYDAADRIRAEGRPPRRRPAAGSEPTVVVGGSGPPIYDGGPGSPSDSGSPVGDYPDPGPNGRGRRSERRAKKRSDPLRSAIEWVVVIAGAVIVALLVRAFLFEAFWIPSGSMEPTLMKGDRVLVNKTAGEPARGDVVVFERPPEGTFTFPGCNGGPSVVVTRSKDRLDPSVVDLIKRVIGLPGDEVTHNQDGTVAINGKSLEEPYLTPGTVTPPFESTESQCLKVPEGMVFVLGDNRNNSQASNVFGPIAESSIVGHAFIRIWPPDRAGSM